MAGTHGRRLSLGATLGAIGVVYGDIGTSPLYALEQSLHATGSDGHSATALLGVLSLMFWSLLAVVTIKYVTLMMRADNEGEGGILSLFALVQRRLEDAPRWGRAVIALAVMGAALFYCDALITPAISVLGAVEGLELLNADMARVVVPADPGDHHAAVRDPAPRHGAGRAPVRADHAAVVCGAGVHRRRCHRAQSAGAARARSASAG